MKKIILISITAALLIAAVLCTAGCVSEDRIVGTYMTENDTAVIYAVFEKEGTGGFVGVAKEGGISDAMGLPFNWKADGNNAYTLAFADGTTEAAVLDAKRGILTIGGVEYEKQTSAVGGTMPYGMGDVKVGGNYAAGIFAHEKSKHENQSEWQ